MRLSTIRDWLRKRPATPRQIASRVSLAIEGLRASPERKWTDNPIRSSSSGRGTFPPEVSNLISQLRPVVPVVTKSVPYSATELDKEARRIIGLSATTGATVTAVGPLSDYSGLEVSVESEDFDSAPQTITSAFRLEFVQCQRLSSWGGGTRPPRFGVEPQLTPRRPDLPRVPVLHYRLRREAVWRRGGGDHGPPLRNGHGLEESAQRCVHGAYGYREFRARHNAPEQCELRTLNLRWAVGFIDGADRRWFGEPRRRTLQTG